MTFDVVEKSVKESFVFLKENFKLLFFQVLKIKAISFFTLIISLLLVGIIFFYTIYNPYKTLSSNLSVVVFGLIVGLLLLFVGIFFSSLVDSTIINLISKYGKTNFGLKEQLSKNSFPFLKYFVLDLLLNLVIFAIILLPSVLLSMTVQNISASKAIDAFTNLTTMITGAILYVFLQFALFEVIVAGTGVIKSFKNSIQTAKNNLHDVFLFGIILYLIEVAVTIPVMIVYLVIIFFGILIGILLVGINQTFLLPLILVGAFLFVVLVTVYSALNTLINYSFRYTFWKNINLINEPKTISGTVNTLVKEKILPPVTKSKVSGSTIKV
ncbi:MAG: hypothetical protein AABX38_02905 [Candidatus Micrarchaeota archaeon]